MFRTVLDVSYSRLFVGCAYVIIANFIRPRNGVRGTREREVRGGIHCGIGEDAFLMESKLIKITSGMCTLWRRRASVPSSLIAETHVR